MKGVLVMLSVLLVAQGAIAEEQEDALDGDIQQELFDQGVEALRLNQFTRARDLFRRCLIEDPHPATAFNLARALRATGETRASLMLFDDLLVGRFGELSSGQIEEVRHLRAETFGELATLHVTTRGAPRVELRIDGELLSTLEGGERVQRQVDAGSRLISASAAGFRTAERRVALEQGSSVFVELELDPDVDELLPVEAARELPETDGGREVPVVRRAWFWVVLGLSAAVVGVGIWLAVDRPWNDTVEGHPVFGVIQTLSASRTPSDDEARRVH